MAPVPKAPALGANDVGPTDPDTILRLDLLFLSADRFKTAGVPGGHGRFLRLKDGLPGLHKTRLSVLFQSIQLCEP